MLSQCARMLAAARQQAGLTQAQLAQRAGVPRSAVSLYENGAREPGAEVFLRLIRAAGADVTVTHFSPEQIHRADVISDLLLFAEELPRRWPGDHLDFPTAVWKTAQRKSQ